ncbi:hypothetical protein [Virgibacillus senegalensis]|uniref:hypothetical protein n=1 Tax=Virgibacillus senegalensis TaxID=1499679 RepID=UPI00069CE5F4|nr:hypothetical protein [Virgibacillus senegalensis]
MKKFSWISYIALLVSLYPFLFTAQIWGWVESNPDFIDYDLMVPTVIISVIVTIIFSIIALFKKTEKNHLAIIAMLISLFNGVLMSFAAMMSNIT